MKRRSFFPGKFTSILILTIGLGGASMRAQDSSQDVPWNFTGETEGLKLFQKDVPGSKLFAFKGEGEIDAPISRVFGIMIDYRRAAEWIDRLREFRIVKRMSLTHFVTYSYVNTPFVIKDRDFLTEAQIDVNAEKKQILYQTHSVEDSEFPEGSAVRAHLDYARYILEPRKEGSATFLSAEFHVDPKGSTPAWIVNLFQKSWPVKTFRGVRNQVKKSDLQYPQDFAPLISDIKKIEQSRTPAASQGE